MDTSVWVITSKTRDEMEARVRRNGDGFAAELLREVDLTISRFSEENFREQGDTAPPLRYDYRVVGGIWRGNINPGTDREFNTCREASELPTENLPRVVISPQGYPASAPTAEEKQEIRRVLRHWPDNVVLALDTKPPGTQSPNPCNLPAPKPKSKHPWPQPEGTNQYPNPKTRNHNRRNHNRPAAPIPAPNQPTAGAVMNPAPEPSPTSMSRPFRKGLPGQFEPASPTISEETSRPFRATYPRRLEPGIRAISNPISRPPGASYPRPFRTIFRQTRQPHAGQSQPPSRSSTPTRPGPNPGPLQPPERDRQDALHIIP